MHLEIGTVIDHNIKICLFSREQVGILRPTPQCHTSFTNIENNITSVGQEKDISIIKVGMNSLSNIWLSIIYIVISTDHTVRYILILCIKFEREKNAEFIQFCQLCSELSVIASSSQMNH